MTDSDGATLLEFSNCVVQVIHTDKLENATVLGKSELVHLSLGHFSSSPSITSSPSNSHAHLPTTSSTNAPPLPPRSKSPSPPKYDEWLILSLPGRYTLPLPAVARVTKDGERAYVFPIEVELFPLSIDAKSSHPGSESEKPEFGPDRQLRVVLPSTTTPTEIELFEDILANRTSFAAQPSNAFSAHVGEVVMIDERTGDLVGTLSSPHIDASSLPDEKADPDGLHSKDPVLITASTDPSTGRQLLRVAPLNYVPIEGYGGSKTIGLANLVSRGIVMGSNAIAGGMTLATKKYVESTKRVEKDKEMKVGEGTRGAVEWVHGAGVGTAKVTGRTAAAIGAVAESLGARLGRGVGLNSEKKAVAGKDGVAEVKHPTGIRGFVNRSLVAFNAVLEGVESGGKHVIATAVESGATVVGHKYGDEAEDVARKTLGLGNSVALVYIDVRGVSRRALLKSVGRAAIKGKTKTGQTIEFQPGAPGQSQATLMVPTDEERAAASGSPAPEKIKDGWKP